MRLDEWQKYLDAQFLDEKEAPTAPLKQLVTSTPTASSSPIPEEMGFPLSLFSEVIENTAAPAPEAIPEIEKAPNVDQGQDNRQRAPRSKSSPQDEKFSLTPEERVLLEAPLSSSELEEAPRPAPPIASRSETPRGERLERRRGTTPSAFIPLDPAESTIPAFDSYLPASHAASRIRKEETSEAVVEAPPALIEPNTLTGVSSVLMPTTEYGISNEPAWSPQSPSIEQITQQTTEYGIVPADPWSPQTPAVEQITHQPSLAEAKRAARRSPSRRAPHARNVIPERVSPGLSAAELWAEVPKHVQTLLALGRIEDEKEIAQFSYKRPFQEKRNELIARLLDPILSLEDAARLLNVCPTTVRRYTNKGILNHYRKEPEPVNNGTLSDKSVSDKETRQRRFRLSDILTFLEAQQAALEEDKQNLTGRRPRKTEKENFESQGHESQDRNSTPIPEPHLAS